jgi:hypothetical protein
MAFIKLHFIINLIAETRSLRARVAQLKENIELPYPKCKLNDIPLSIQISEEQETCPLNKW